MVEPFVGTIQYFGFNFAPRGWSLCQGQTMTITQYQALYALLGVQFGGDGRTNFMLPDLQGRAIIGAGAGANLSAYIVGNKGGSESISIPATALPVHTHTISGTMSIPASSGGPDPSLLASNNYPADADGLYSTTSTSGSFLGAPSVAVNNAGGNMPVSVINPYIALTCCIALMGLFPSRN